MSAGHVEATAPCQVELAGGTPGPWPLFLPQSGAVSVHVAIDRRAWCGIDGGVRGVAVASKDSLQKSQAPTVEALLAKGPSLVGEILRVLEVDEGVHVQTLFKVPPGSGLGETSALALAVAGGVSAVLGRPFEPEGLWPDLREAEARASQAPVGARDYGAALRGGVRAVRFEGGEVHSEALSVDPARVEESLVLVDAGDAPPPDPGLEDDLASRLESPGPDREALAAGVATGAAVRQALLDDRFEDVVGLLQEEWEARRTLDPGLSTPEVERVVGVVHEAGGAARRLSTGGRAVVAIWAPPGARGPGRREAVTTALGAAGFRVFPARVDLRGLEVG